MRLFTLVSSIVRAAWQAIQGIVAESHDWLIVDRMSLGRGDGKPSKNIRYRYQVMAGDQSIAYGFRSVRAAKKWLVPLMAMGGNAISSGLAASGVDFATFA